MKRQFSDQKQDPSLGCYLELLAGFFLACVKFEQNLEKNQKVFRLCLESSDLDFLQFLSKFLPVPSQINKIEKEGLCFYQWSVSQNKPEKLKLQNPNPFHLCLEKEDSILFLLKMMSGHTYPGLLPNTEESFLKFARNYIEYTQPNFQDYKWDFELEPFYFQSLRRFPTAFYDRGYLERPAHIEAWFASYLTPFLSMGFEFEKKGKETKIIPFLKISDSPLHKAFDKDWEQWRYLEEIFHLPFYEEIVNKGNREMILKEKEKINRESPLDSDFHYFLLMLSRGFSKLQNKSKKSFIPLPQHKEIKKFTSLVDKIIDSKEISSSLLQDCTKFNKTLSKKNKKTLKNENARSTKKRRAK